MLKTTAPERESKIGECHATAYAFLRLWYEFQVRKCTRFVRFTFHVKKVYTNLTGMSLSRKI